MTKSILGLTRIRDGLRPNKKVEPKHQRVWIGILQIFPLRRGILPAASLLHGITH